MTETKTLIALQDEIKAILFENKNMWMTTRKISDLVIRRGIYKRADGLELNPWQVANCINKHPDMFELDDYKARCK